MQQKKNNLPDYSEFTFAICLIQSIIEQARQKGIVCFPDYLTPHQEKHDDKYKGADVLIHYLNATPLFLQFKRSTAYKIGPNDPNIAQLISVPSFWAKIESGQHGNLLKLRENQAEVYYAVPLFSSKAELRSHFQNSKVLENSAFVSPELNSAASPGAINNGVYLITRGNSSPKQESMLVYDEKSAYFCSTPKETKKYLAGNKLVEWLCDLGKSKQYGTVEHYLKTLFSIYIQPSASWKMWFDGLKISNTTTIEREYSALRAFFLLEFDVEFLLFGFQPNIPSPSNVFDSILSKMD